MKNGQKMSDKFRNILTFLIVLSITLIPPIRLSENLPSIQFLDLLLPFIALFVLVNRNQIIIRRFYWFLGGFTAYIFLTMIINHRLTQLRDYFEIFKLLKFLLVILYFSIIPIKELKNKVFTPIFAALVIFNLLHYFNVFNFNEIIELYYNGGVHIKVFGLNSLGLPATKRMMGAIGNPNNNAIMFLFFSILFYPKNNQNKKELFVFFTAIFMFFLCQSRTGFVALFLIIFLSLIYDLRSSKLPLLKRFNYKSLLIIVVAYFFSSLFSLNIIETNVYISRIGLNGEEIGLDGNYTSSYLNSLFNSSVFKSNSVQGRLIVWKELWEMIQLKPFFGHAPFKEYFYENKIYAESEYVLMTWRYGFIGLILYFILLGQLLYVSYKNLNKQYAKELFLFTIVIAVTGLTNTPLNCRELLIFYGIIIGLFFNTNQWSKNEKQS